MPPIAARTGQKAGRNTIAAARASASSAPTTGGVVVGDTLPRSARLRLNKSTCGTRKPKKVNPEKERTSVAALGTGNADTWVSELASNMGFGGPEGPEKVGQSVAQLAVGSTDLASQSEGTAAMRTAQLKRGSRKNELRNEAKRADRGSARVSQAVRASGNVHQPQQRGTQYAKGSSMRPDHMT